MKASSSLLMMTTLVLMMHALKAQAQSARVQRLEEQVIAVRASASQPGHQISLINDGEQTAASPFWTNYSGNADAGEWAYVEYAWDTQCLITRTQVTWATQGDSILLPQEAYLAWWDGSGWHHADDIAAPNANATSTNRPEELQTNRLRLYARSSLGIGIRELIVYGRRFEDCEVPRLSATAQIISIPKGASQTLQPQLQLPADAEGEVPVWLWLDAAGEIIAEGPALEVSQAGFYTAMYQRPCGSAAVLDYTVSIDGKYDPEMGYLWPSYEPTIDYDFRSEYPALPAPTKGRLPENVNVKRERHGEWWSVAVGPNANALISDTAMTLLAKKMDEDFAYFRNEMGWPPDKRARNGYYSQVYGYGSGLSFDAGTPNTATGGWQSTTNYQGSSWPMVFLSYYPIYSFDPKCTYGDRIAQQNLCVHEGIHATFADLEGCRNSAWFHEGGNTWLQGEAEIRKSGKEPESMGWLSAGNMLAPFMPIECYSGWLQDDSFGGPSAEGVNMYDGGQQICTWRRLLGGVQYGELFPHFCSEILGKGSIPWIWRYCKSRVLEGMAKGTTEKSQQIPGLGDTQMRRLILEYRARQAMIDIGVWTKACEALIDNNWLATIEAEWQPSWIKCKAWRATPYAQMTACQADSAGWWRPEWRTTPGWSGANQVVIHTSGKAGDDVSVGFHPLGRNMVCQLCFRTRSGNVYYGMPVSSGVATIRLTEAPANGVIIAVVCNTDYVYTGEALRKTHFDYRLQMLDNAYQPASPYFKWYKYRQTIRDNTYDYSAIDQLADATNTPATFSITPARIVVTPGEQLPIRLTGVQSWQVPVQLYSAAGQLIAQQSFLRDGNFELPITLPAGIYVLRAADGHRQATARLMVR